MYGVQAGVMYGITDNIELELGISYSMMDAEPQTAPLTQTQGNTQLINARLFAELEDMTRAYLGVNLKF